MKDLKKFFFVIKGLLFISLIAGIYNGLQYIMVDNTNSMTRIMFHDFYEMDENIDTVFLGSSHVQKGINAEALSVGTGKQCFDLATSSQGLSQSYFLLKEAEKYYEIDAVYLEISLYGLAVEKDDTATYIVSDYLKDGWNKYQLIKANIEPEQYINAYFPLCRTINILDAPLNFLSGLEALNRKRESAYRNYEDKWIEDMDYKGRGFYQSTGEDVYEKKISAESSDLHIVPEDFDEKQLGYLHEIIEECRNNDISLTLFIAPFSDLYVAAQTEEYEKCIDYLKKMAEEKQVVFIDFNTVARTDLKLSESCFADHDHLNAKGAEIFTDYMSGYINSTSSYRQYNSASERLESEKDIYGIVFESDWVNELGMYRMELLPVSNLDAETHWECSVVDEYDKVIYKCADFYNVSSMTVLIPDIYKKNRLRMQAVNENDEEVFVSHIMI